MFAHPWAEARLEAEEAAGWARSGVQQVTHARGGRVLDAALLHLVEEERQWRHGVRRQEVAAAGHFPAGSRLNLREQSEGARIHVGGDEAGA